MLTTGWMLTPVKDGGDFVHAVAISAVTHSGMLEAEAWSTSLRILGVQVEVAQFTPESKMQKFISNETGWLIS